MDELRSDECAQMVADQIERRGLRDPRLLQAFLEVPRHHFVPLTMQSRAYDDGPLPIGKGQTISQPYIVALMTSLLQLKGDEVVLEVGTGSGYQAAILAQLVRWVHSIERHRVLAERARALLGELDYHNVSVHIGDGSLGWVEAAPYAAIIVTAAATAPPPPLLEQLAEGGRLVIPVGGYGSQILQVWEKTNGCVQHENITPVNFVPLRGAHGWNSAEWSDNEDEG
jgi:protein-L-isoaspartate(D-aspartate) O-methyltransferase